MKDIERARLAKQFREWNELTDKCLEENTVLQAEIERLGEELRQKNIPCDHNFKWDIFFERCTKCFEVRFK
jgi:hypothetical protein